MVLSPTASQSITLVFNTGCTPCIREIRELMELYKRKNDTRIEFIFLLPERGENISFRVAMYLLKEYETSPEAFGEALAGYVDEYPGCLKKIKAINFTPDEKSRFEAAIKQQAFWCMENKVISTPAVFFNHRLLPDEYTLLDIDYMCD